MNWFYVTASLVLALLAQCQHILLSSLTISHYYEQLIFACTEIQIDEIFQLPAITHNKIVAWGPIRNCVHVTYPIANHGNSLAKSTDSLDLGAFADVSAQYSLSDEVYCYHC